LVSEEILMVRFILLFHGFLGMKFHRPKIEGDYGLETWSWTFENVSRKAGIPSPARLHFLPELEFLQESGIPG
jgi:hypothetical protein